MLRRLLATDPQARHRIVIAPPSALRAGYVRSLQPLLIQRARDQLARQRPALSARRTFTLVQSLTVFAGLVALFSALLLDAFMVLLGLHLFAPCVYFAIAGLRLSAWRRAGRQETRQKWPEADDAALPTYSVLVALYQEANQAQALVAALMRLRWPLEKLEFKLICEADDIFDRASVGAAISEEAIVAAGRPDQPALIGPLQVKGRATPVVIYGLAR